MAKKIRYAVACIAISGLVILIGIIGIRPMAKAIRGKWQSIWVLNAPELNYAKNSSENLSQEEAAAIINRLTLGDQYGIAYIGGTEIPLYYGDTEDILEQGVGIYAGYGVPGQKQTSLIGGHDTTYFACLEEVKEGDVITLSTLTGAYDYVVTKTEVKDVTDLKDVTLAEDKEGLVLYTCYPFGKTDTDRSQRFLVYADIEKK